MSRALKRQVLKAKGGRGVKASPARPARTPEQRVNRILLIGGGALAAGAVALALLSPQHDLSALGVNLAAIAIGLLMGKGVGKFVFRRPSAAHGNPVTLSTRSK